MRKRTKIGLTTATAFIALGILLFGVIMTFHLWDFSKLKTIEYHTSEEIIDEPFQNLYIQTEFSDVTLLPSDDGTCKISFCQLLHELHVTTVEDNTLMIDFFPIYALYQTVGPTFGDPKITIYLPRTEYDSLNIQTGSADVNIPQDFHFKSISISSSLSPTVNSRASVDGAIEIKTEGGKIDLANVSAETLDVTTNSGKIFLTDVTCHDDITIHAAKRKIELTNVKCKSISTCSTTGKTLLNNVIAEETLLVESTKGNVYFNSCDAARIVVQTTRGDVSGTLLSPKIFTPQTERGKVKLEECKTGGDCKITTQTGDIQIRIQP